MSTAETVMYTVMATTVLYAMLGLALVATLSRDDERKP